MIVDRLLLLHSINKINQKGRLENSFKLQKIIFKVQNNLIHKRIKAINYMFIRWNKGPFSADVSADVDFLTDNNLVTSNKENIKITKTGELVLKECSEIFENNKAILRFFSDVVNDFATKNVDEIKKEIYSLEIFVPKIHKKMIINDIPIGVPLLFKLADKTAKNKIKIGENWIDTIEELFEIDNWDK